jgi:hypothetical protein
MGFGPAMEPAAPNREGGERDLIPTKHSEGIGGYHEGAREPIFKTWLTGAEFEMRVCG